MNTARYALCLTGLIAFSLTFVIGMRAGGGIIEVLRDAAIACVVAGLLGQVIFNTILSAVNNPEPDPPEKSTERSEGAEPETSSARENAS
jgi:hypothetical protein